MKNEPRKKREFLMFQIKFFFGFIFLITLITIREILISYDDNSNFIA